MSVKYYYIIMSQIDMLQNQVLEEILREKANYYFSKNKSIDFWITISPKFINESNLTEEIKVSNFYKQRCSEIVARNGNDFYSALVSLDKDFINWIKLRLGYFENLKTLKTQNIGSNYISDGIYGEIESNSSSFLNHNKRFVHPYFYVSKYKKGLALYYKGIKNN